MHTQSVPSDTTRILILNSYLYGIRFHASPSRLCRSGLRGFGDLRQKHTPVVLEYASRGFLYLFNNFRAHKPCSSVSELLGALRRPQKNMPLEFWSMYLVDLVNVRRLQGPHGQHFGKFDEKINDNSTNPYR